MFLTCLVTNQVVVGRFVNTDFLLDKIVTSLVANKFAVNRAKCYDRFCCERQSELYSLQVVSAKTFPNLQPDCCKTGLILQWQKAQYRYSTRFAATKQVKRFSDFLVLGGGGDGENRPFFALSSPITPFPIVFWFELGSAFVRLYSTTLEKHTHQKNDVT